MASRFFGSPGGVCRKTPEGGKVLSGEFRLGPGSLRGVRTELVVDLLAGRDRLMGWESRKEQQGYRVKGHAGGFGQGPCGMGSCFRSYREFSLFLSFSLSLSLSGSLEFNPLQPPAPSI